MYQKFIKLVILGFLSSLLIIQGDTSVYSQDEFNNSTQESNLLKNNESLDYNAIFIVSIIISFGVLSIYFNQSNKNNQKAIKDLEIEISKYNLLFKEAETSNNKRKSEIRYLAEKIDGMITLIEDENIDHILTASDINNQSISPELKSIYSKFQQIDKKLSKLEKANQIITITGSKSNPQPKSINISENELINLYNYTPQILAEYAFPVSITAETYQNQAKENIYLEYTVNGYYWVILREKDNQQFYHLVPNSNRNLNLYRLANQVKSLFTIQGKQEPNIAILNEL